MTAARSASKRRDVAAYWMRRLRGSVDAHLRVLSPKFTQILYLKT